MKKEEILNEIELCELQMSGWVNKNSVLWKDAFNRRKELLNELNLLKEEVPISIPKKETKKEISQKEMKEIDEMLNNYEKKKGKSLKSVLKKRGKK